MITIDQFRGFLAVHELSDSTIRSYSALAMRWCDHAIGAGTNPYRPEPIEVRRWAHQLAGSRSLAAQAKAMLGHWCRANEVDDVSEAFPVPRQARTHRTRGIPPDEARQLARAARVSGLPGLAVLVGLYTAARRSEIASLAWGRIELDRGMVTLERPKTRDLHTVPLHPDLHAELAPRRVPGERWVFPGRYGGHVSPATIGTWVGAVAQQAGIGHVTPHQLRHTALTEANERTGDLRAVQELAGHTSPEITARYTTVSEERRARAVESLRWAC